MHFPSRFPSRRTDLNPVSQIPAPRLLANCSTIIGLLLLLGGSPAAYAQDVTIGNNGDAVGYSTYGNYVVGQSFTATKTGVLKSIAFASFGNASGA